MPAPSPDARESDRQVAEILAEVRRIPLRQARFVTDVLSGGYRSLSRGLGIEFAEVREYAEGDDPRYVDWNVTARVGRPFVKRFVEEREHTVLFAVDGSPSMRNGLGSWSATEAAARFVAMLGLMAIDNNDSAGLLAGGGGGEPSYVPPRRGARHVLSLIHRCLHHRTTASPDGLDRLLEACLRRQRRRTVVFMLSDFLFPLPDRTGVLGACARRHDLVLVHLLAPDLHDPPQVALRTFDAESGRRRAIDLADPAVRRAWLDRVERFRRNVEARCAEVRAEWLEIPVPRNPDIVSLAAPVQQFLRRRQQREARR